MPLASTSTDGLGTLVGVAEQGWWDDDHDGWGWGGWLVMMGVMVIFWVAVALLVVWAVRSWGGGRPGPGQAPLRSPLDIARERYARGEINDEEFERIRRGLSRD
ncbi:MAG: SHOCT domain-containing protein [Thermoflexaceae bacterium]|nr:SHOCT domain-containing protein [Thermoflexaceae bacterium]